MKFLSFVIDADQVGPFLLNSFLNTPLDLGGAAPPELSVRASDLGVFIAHWVGMVARTSYSGKNSTGAST